ncbi:UNVERIFIED_CONTAM: hypothetical protein HDU68_010634 [Siphonaria sp. JEL0065]|nr:hypothetical protein HDU68_010634 [Siphonaria sp. JEL0065]
MCGRTVTFAEQEDIEVAAGTRTWNNPPSLEGRRHRPSYNNCPMRLQPVITTSSSNNGRQLSLMQWGIKTNTHTPNPTLSINAREDTLVSSASTTWNPLRDSFRAVLPTQGFFEWFQKPNSTKTVPYYIHSVDLTVPTKSEPSNATGFLYYACLYQPSTSNDAAPTFTIITTTSEGSEMEWLHGRMPVILTNQEDIDLWLDPSVKFESVKGLMKPLKTGLKWFEVDPFVNKIANNNIECIVPVKEKSGSLFKFLKPDVSNIPSGSISITAIIVIVLLVVIIISGAMAGVAWHFYKMRKSPHTKLDGIEEGSAVSAELHPPPNVEFLVSADQQQSSNNAPSSLSPVINDIRLVTVEVVEPVNDASLEQIKTIRGKTKPHISNTLVSAMETIKDKNQSQTNDPSSWTPEIVSHWVLNNGGTSQTAKAVIDQDIDGASLLALKIEEYASVLGITRVGERIRLELALRKLIQPPSYE